MRKQVNMWFPKCFINSDMSRRLIILYPKRIQFMQKKRFQVQTNKKTRILNDLDRYCTNTCTGNGDPKNIHHTSPSGSRSIFETEFFSLFAGEICKPSNRKEDVLSKTAGMIELENIGVDTPVYSNLFETKQSDVTLQRRE